MKKQIIIGFLALTAIACRHDYYETGDSALSYLHTEFVDATTNYAQAFASAITDDNTSLTLSPAIAAKWATTPDSTYRALLYYNKVENGITKPIAIKRVLTLKPTLISEAKQQNTDPLTLESAWIGKKKKYLNLSLIIKTGIADDEKAIQSVGLLQTVSRLQKNGTSKAYYFTLAHNQGGVPAYYSSKAYASIPLSTYQQGDSLYVTINTYKGVVTKTFKL